MRRLLLSQQASQPLLLREDEAGMKSSWEYACSSMAGLPALTVEKVVTGLYEVPKEWAELTAGDECCAAMTM